MEIDHVRTVAADSSWIVFALALGGWSPRGLGPAGDGHRRRPRPAEVAARRARGHHRTPTRAAGTLGYGPPGLHPGFQGFGLGYHPGYGYGGDGLGVGADGGYPFYGGPGYPHPWPTLRRLGGITPFPYFGGPGYPTPDHPNYFGGVGPLVPDRPVVVVENEPRAPPGTTAASRHHPLSRDEFAPFTTIAATTG